MAEATSANALTTSQETGAAAEEQKKRDEQGKVVLYHFGLNTFTLMSVFTQRIDALMSLKEFDGDITKVAVRAGTLTALGSLCEMLANPFLGKISDAVGRRPLMLASPIANVFFKLLVVLNPSKFFLELDKVVGTTFSVVGGTTMVLSANADLYAGNPTRQASANITANMYAALGIILGPMFGIAASKSFGSWRGAYLGSALMSLLHVAHLLRLQEPLALALRRPFTAAGANPLSFLKLLGEGRQFLTLALLGGIMQGIPEGKNLADIHQTFSSSDVGMSETARSTFVSFFGFCQVVGSIAANKLTVSMGGQQFTSLATLSVSACMVWYSTVPIMLRKSWPMFVGAAMGVFVSSVPNYTKAVATEYAKKANWGVGEFQGAMSNLRSLTSAVIPMFLAAVYAWSKRGGRHRPGLAYQLIAALGLLTELIFRTLSAKDLAIKP